MHRKGVYSIPCSCGKAYRGEIGHSVKVVIKECCVDIIHGSSKMSSIIEHSQVTNNHICIEEAKIIAIKDHYKKCA